MSVLARVLPTLLCAFTLIAKAAAGPLSITLSTNGPGNFPHLPVDLIKKIGADRAEGVDLTVRYFAGGPLAYRDMLEKNADFAVAGAPALAGLRLKGEAVVSIASINRVPPYVLLVRADLKSKVRRVADLRGRVIGTTISTTKSKSTSQQTVEFVLRRAGVRPDQINFVPAGQSLEDELAALESGAVDAVMAFEPFASRIVEAGKAHVLLDLYDLKACRQAMGGLFLHSQLATRADVVRTAPDKVARMVRVLNRTLTWIAGHSAEDIVASLAPPDPESRAALLKTLRHHKAIFSPDGVFSREQIRVAERFFRENNAADPAAAAFSFDSLVEPRWAGLVE